MKSFYLVFVLLVSTVFSVSAYADGAWSRSNNPFKFGHLETNLKRLPSKGSLRNRERAWPGFYWANKKGGIAQRWNSLRPQHFSYISPSKAEITRYTTDKINRLSPAEKYDIYMGRFDYPTVRKAWSQTSEKSKGWHGICHGVAPSSIHHNEPKQTTVFSKDGIEITFYASDIKALLAYHYAKISDAKTTQIGRRCNTNKKVPFLRATKNCKDVNAATFHLVLTNKLGLERKGFIADIDRFSQVWNHAPVKYRSFISRPRKATRRDTFGATSKVRVTSRVTYAGSITPNKNKVIATKYAKYSKQTYVYWLHLDARNRIIGGEWESKTRPDFLWFKERSIFTGYWQGVEEIYNSAF